MLRQYKGVRPSDSEKFKEGGGGTVFRVRLEDENREVHISSTLYFKCLLTRPAAGLR